MSLIARTIAKFYQGVPLEHFSLKALYLLEQHLLSTAQNADASRVRTELLTRLP